MHNRFKTFFDTLVQVYMWREAQDYMGCLPCVEGVGHAVRWDKVNIISTSNGSSPWHRVVQFAMLRF